MVVVVSLLLALFLLPCLALYWVCVGNAEKRSLTASLNRSPLNGAFVLDWMELIDPPYCNRRLVLRIAKEMFLDLRTLLQASSGLRVLGGLAFALFILVVIVKALVSPSRSDIQAMLGFEAAIAP